MIHKWGEALNFIFRVVEACCAYLRKQLHPSNCLGIAAFADSQGKFNLLSSIENHKWQQIRSGAGLTVLIIGLKDLILSMFTIFWLFFEFSDHSDLFPIYVPVCIHLDIAALQQIKGGATLEPSRVLIFAKIYLCKIFTYFPMQIAANTTE